MCLTVETAPQGMRSRSRSPRRNAKVLPLYQGYGQYSIKPAPKTGVKPVESTPEHCHYCGLVGHCEYGRDSEFCSMSCYMQASVGADCVFWDMQEVEQWLMSRGLARWAVRKLMGEQHVSSGEDMLTKVNEGQLLKLKMPKPRAKELVRSIECLRRGAWLQPEPPLLKLPLETIGLLANQVGSKWAPVMEDIGRRSFAYAKPKAVDNNTAWSWFQALHDKLPWQDLSDERYQANGKTIPRRTIFAVSPGCKCVYKYSGVTVPPTEEPPFVAEMRRKCVAVAGLKTQPNSCNINLYRNGHDSVGWHTDDEEIFEAGYNDACILSLSLGAKRKFEIKLNKHQDPNGAVDTLDIAHGDLCSMEGRFQRYYLHAVPKQPGVQEPRINLTWRWITKHNQVDGCPLHGPGNIMQ